MEDAKVIEWWKLEIQKLKIELDTQAAINRNLRQDIGNYLEMIQPLMAAAYRWGDGKLNGEYIFPVAAAVFGSYYYNWLSNHKEFQIPLKDFDIESWLKEVAK